MKQLAAATSENFILPPTPYDPYPSLPLELDDEYIFPTYLESQPMGITSVITGFNVNVRIFLSYDSLEAVDLAIGFGALSGIEQQKKTLHQSLHQCKSILDTLPTELVVVPRKTQPGGPDDTFQPPSASNIFMQDPALLNSSDQEVHTEDRRKVQYEIQKANIYASHLGTRSYIVEKYWNVYAAQTEKPRKTHSSPTGSSINAEANLQQLPASSHDLTEEEIFAERDSIVKDLLLVLSSISQVSMEPNADSLVSTHNIPCEANKRLMTWQYQVLILLRCLDNEDPVYCIYPARLAEVREKLNCVSGRAISGRVSRYTAQAGTLERRSY